MIRKWVKIVDNKNLFGALLTDVPIIFDCIPQVIAKLHPHEQCRIWEY